MISCVFVDERGGTPSEGHITARQAYSVLKAWLDKFFPESDVELDIRPFQLVYRKFDLYLVDIGGMEGTRAKAFMVALGNVVRGRMSRKFLFWTNTTWELFKQHNPDLAEADCCINCCRPADLERVLPCD